MLNILNMHLCNISGAYVRLVIRIREFSAGENLMYCEIQGRF